MPSIIQAIKDAILTEISSDVRIQDRSFWSQLLEEKKKDHDPSAWSMRWKVRTDKPFIVTRFLFRCLYNILLCFIWLCNVIYEFIFRGFSGRWRGYSKEESKDIKGRDIFRKGIRPSAGINIILAGLALVAGIVAIVYIIVFNISNVVLAPSNLRTNTNGIFSIDQPGFETQHYFLLNAANFWTPTGIALSEGDKVYITASGSMYGDIYNMDTCSRENKKLEYSRSIIGPNTQQGETSTKNIEYCIYGRNKQLETNARFGSLLYQVAPSVPGPKPFNSDTVSHIKQIEWDTNNTDGYSFTVKDHGELYFCFNDILLNTAILKKIQADYIHDTSNQDLKKLYEPLLICGWYRDSLKKIDSLAFKHGTSTAHFTIYCQPKNDSPKKNYSSILNKSIIVPVSKVGWKKQKSFTSTINLTPHIETRWFSDTMGYFIRIDGDSLTDELLNSLKNNNWFDVTEPDTTIWFQDNLGEVLINVRVEHNLGHTAIPFPKKMMTLCYRGVEHFRKWPKKRHLTMAGYMLLAITLACLEPVMIRGIRKIRRRKDKAKSSSEQATEAL
ncbi:MAG: hypothetical protein J6S56_05515 [Bacteroidales bacterium]|nr:hypothetical protein [Bacteroidales bacterium]